jgi:hypothetical protein
MADTKDLAVIDNQLSRSAFEPRDLAEAMDLGARLVKSGLLPQAIKTPEAALAVLLTGRERGLTAMQSFRLIHVIDGKPSLASTLMIADCRRSGLAEHISLVETTNDRCVYRTKRRGDRVETTIEWSMEDAKRAGLTGKTNWQKYPRAMLRSRCEAELSRAVYPEVCAGIYTPDELGAVIDVESYPVEPRSEAPRVEPVKAPTKAAVIEAEVEPAKEAPARTRSPRADAASDHHRRVWNLARGRGWSSDAITELCGRMFGGRKFRELEGEDLARLEDAIEAPSDEDVAADAENKSAAIAVLELARGGGK